MKNRRKARELALQVLYQIEMRKASAEEALEVIFSRYRFKQEVREFVETLGREQVVCNSRHCAALLDCIPCAILQ